MSPLRFATDGDEAVALLSEVISPTPLFPATRFAHVVGASLPTGVTAPRPVITARRICAFDGRARRRAPLT